LSSARSTVFGRARPVFAGAGPHGTHDSRDAYFVHQGGELGRSFEPARFAPADSLRSGGIPDASFSGLTLPGAPFSFERMRSRAPYADGADLSRLAGWRSRSRDRTHL